MPTLVSGSADISCTHARSLSTGSGLHANGEGGGARTTTRVSNGINRHPRIELSPPFSSVLIFELNVSWGLLVAPDICSRQFVCVVLCCKALVSFVCFLPQF